MFRICCLPVFLFLPCQEEHSISNDDCRSAEHDDPPRPPRVPGLWAPVLDICPRRLCQCVGGHIFSVCPRLQRGVFQLFNRLGIAVTAAGADVFHHTFCGNGRLLRHFGNIAMFQSKDAFRIGIPAGAGLGPYSCFRAGRFLRYSAAVFMRMRLVRQLWDTLVLVLFLFPTEKDASNQSAAGQKHNYAPQPDHAAVTGLGTVSRVRRLLRR